MYPLAWEGDGILCEGDAHPALLMCGLPLALPDWRGSPLVGGSRIDGGPYAVG
jgi:hypothetical protein